MSSLKTISTIILTTLLCITFNSYSQKVTVMTFNIYHGEKNYDKGKSNIEQVASVINEYKPDFVAMQEVDSMTQRTAAFNNGVPQDLVKNLAKLTGMHGFFAKAIDYSGGGYGEGLLSRFPAQPTVFSLPIPKGGEGRALIAVQSKLPSGEEIIFAGTHLCHEFAENRLAQAEAVAKILDGFTLPVIAGGDFNIRPDTEPYNVLTKNLIDAAVAKGNPQFTIPYHNPRARIDYIFLSKKNSWVVEDVKVIKTDASDHMPVLVTLTLKK